MRYSGKRVGPGPKRSARRVAREDPHDVMALEFLRLWMGLARLREGIPQRVGRPPLHKPPTSKTSRRKAA
jgi:hypothetical protein